MTTDDDLARLRSQFNTDDLVLQEVNLLASNPVVLLLINDESIAGGLWTLPTELVRDYRTAWASLERAEAAVLEYLKATGQHIPSPFPGYIEIPVTDPNFTTIAPPLTIADTDLQDDPYDDPLRSWVSGAFNMLKTMKLTALLYAFPDLAEPGPVPGDSEAEQCANYIDIIMKERFGDDWRTKLVPEADEFEGDRTSDGGDDPELVEAIKHHLPHDEVADPDDMDAPIPGPRQAEEQLKPRKKVVAKAASKVKGVKKIAPIKKGMPLKKSSPKKGK